VTRNPQWTTRLKVTSTIVHVVGFVVAVAGTMATEGLTTATASATLVTAIGVLIAVTVEIPFPRGSQRAIVSIFAAVGLFCVAVGLTGGLTSSFVVMPLASIFLAAIGGGVRAAAPVTIVAVAGVLIAAWAAGDDGTIDAIIRIPAIYTITGIAFSEVQRALTSESERADDLLLATETSRTRRERLEETHDLLEDLLAVATTPDMNAVATAQDALRDIGLVLPSAPTRIVGIGNVNLARRGETPDAAPSDHIAIERADVELARLDLWLDDGALAPSQRAAIESSVIPVALALENDRMVQQLAGLTIQRERVRLARELHDDIAPTIASVGLALDMVLGGGDLDASQQRTLEATRSTVTRLVDRIRDRVQDFRADRTISIVELAHSLVAEVDAEGPTVVVDLDERTPPRPAIAIEVGALIAEAFRNAMRHAQPTMITISGRIDESSGLVAVTDNGVGFDANDPTDGRFGLVGMTERAALIGADLKVESSPGSGTTVRVTWEDAR
jgi:signal transduction histidine kinase